MKYIDAEKLKSEIQSLVDLGYDKLQGNLYHVISLIDSLQLEQPSLPSNLDEAAHNWAMKDSVVYIARKKSFKAGAEWMAKQMNNDNQPSIIHHPRSLERLLLDLGMGSKQKEEKTMTTEDKQLLLRDICARLPYGVKIQIYDGYSAMMKDDELNVFHLDSTYNIEYRKLRPYLRPMSSMTEEEVKEIQKINWQFYKPENGLIECFVGDADDGYCSVSQMTGILDYLNAHHFDYRGLIEKGLALEAPKDMYKTK